MNLLELDDKVIGFAAGVVTPGDFEFIHINIDQAKSNIKEMGAEKTLLLRVPSQEIKILGGFTVGEDKTTTLTLDFDADASLVRQGTGDWLLKPVVVIANTSTGTQ